MKKASQAAYGVGSIGEFADRDAARVPARRLLYVWQGFLKCPVIGRTSTP